MIDTLQIILVFVIVVLAVLFIVLGIQAFLILRDVRKTVTKANKVLDTANNITESVSGPIAALTSITDTLKSGSIITILKLVKSFVGKDEEDERPVRHRRE